MRDQLVDDSPVGEAADVAVVDEHLYFELARVIAGFLHVFVVFADVLVGGIEIDAALFTPFHGLLQEFAFTHAPEDEFVAVFDELAEGGGGKRPLFPDGWVFVFYYGSVEIYSYDHGGVRLMNNCLMNNCTMNNE